ncbi:tRNA 2-thiouridine(34) synthase MnmA [Holophaga foetida]|uniref:tRNA 2-thiouridine(34) synthase MnmA n=1 Tax=Holophaga foetida TaxID=35839 RepID=UPI0002472AED|nr:tRNA 2-thiouridine(34) synthase MnmA [Holophaga foetida]
MGNARIVVAMSGGVDSSVVAGLLKREGHPLIGVTLQLRPCDDRMSSRSCCSMDAINQARAVAGALDIPHYVLDCRADFEEKVLKPAWADYQAGRTPSPCLHCNREIKFGMLLAHAQRLGADRIASGHYARVLHDSSEPQLLRGLDRHKDQSYFLSGLELDALRHLLLPLGSFTKAQVRDMAREMKLPTAERHESQDACLVYEGLSFPESLRQRYGTETHSGNFIDPSGRILGPHQGLHHYTIGQRRGLGIALGQPAHVIGLNAGDGSVILSTDSRDLLATGLRASGVHWYASPPERCEVQIRSRHTATPARVEHLGPAEALVRFDAPQSAVTPGQAVAFYDGERVLGGGWIEAPISTRLQHTIHL